jgi:hypothetical protein
VPDTFDLQERAYLALRAITTCTDPRDNYAPYDNFAIWRNPPVMFSKTLFNGKYMEAASLLRYLTGRSEGQQADQSWRSLFLQAILHGDYPWWGIDGGRLLAWLGNNLHIEKDPCWQDLATRAINSLARQARYKDDYGYFPDEQGQMPTGWAATWSGWVLQGLAALYQSTGSPDVLKLSEKLARFLKDHAQIFDPDGRFLARHPSDRGPALQFHHNGNALEGIAAYAAASGSSEFAAFARSSYDWARSLGSPLVGYFPEYIDDWPDDRPYNDCETCCTADMIQLAMILTQMGQGDYWDDVDRYLRNQFAEMQLLHTAWIDSMISSLPYAAPEPGQDAEQVSKRLLGSFASWATGNDWYIKGQPGTTFCCIGNGARALYYAWEKMLTYENGILRVHLLLNRASIWVDVSSYLPYQGLVDVLVKQGCRLEMRLPEWTQPVDMAAFVNEKARALSFQGHYARLGAVEPGDRVRLEFPLHESTLQTEIGGISYNLVLKGNDVVSIDPPGTYYPFYQRAHFRTGQARMVERERFVPAV